MGTFRESDIGIGTVIVGSAVFNVLFVIGMCSIFAKDVLTLTWWPLFRDSTYYAVGLVVLSMLAGVCSKGHITWWEAAILLGMYVGYVVLMAFNRKLYTLLTGKELVLGGEDDVSKPLLGQESSEQQHDEGYTSFRPDGKGEDHANKSQNEESMKEWGGEEDAQGSICEALMPPQEKVATAWLKYLVSLPLVAAFTFTVPDV